MKYLEQPCLTHFQQIFQETKRFIVAEWQHVIYSEFLPTVLGSNLMSEFQLGPGPSLYEPEVKANIFTEFSTAAYRFGHSMIQNKVGSRTD